jgi:hypothetical protein
MSTIPSEYLNHITAKSQKALVPSGRRESQRCRSRESSLG